MSASAPPDTEIQGLVRSLPSSLRHFALLARFDRPIGWWLLFWPCAWGVLLAGGQGEWALLGWLLLGSIAAWLAAFAVWGARNARIYLTPRIDGRPG